VQAPVAPNSTPPSDRDEEGNRVEPAQGTGGSGPDAQIAALPGLNPVLAKFYADKAARQAELKAAQADAEHRRGIAQAENVISSAFTTQGDDVRKARLEAAGQPVADVLARQKAGDEALAQATGEQKFSQEVNAADPNDPANAQFRDFYAKQGIKLPPGATMAMFPTLAEPILKKQQEAAKQAAEEKKTTAEIQGRKDVANIEGGYKLRAERMKEEGGGAKPLKPAETKDLNALEAENDALEANRTAHHDASFAGGVANKLGIPTDYSRTVEANAGTVAAGKYPGTRGPAAGKMIIKEAPSALASNRSADVYYDSAERTGIQRREAAVRQLEAAHGTNHPEVQQYRARLEADKARLAQGGGERKSVGGRNFVKINDKWHEE
jgi:hypothetical protein